MGRRIGSWCPTIGHGVKHVRGRWPRAGSGGHSRHAAGRMSQRTETFGKFDVNFPSDPGCLREGSNKVGPGHEEPVMADDLTLRRRALERERSDFDPTSSDVESDDPVRES